MIAPTQTETLMAEVREALAGMFRVEGQRYVQEHPHGARPEGPGLVMSYDWPSAAPSGTGTDRITHSFVCAEYVPLPNRSPESADEEMTQVLTRIMDAARSPLRLNGGMGKLVEVRLVNRGRPVEVGEDRREIRKEFGVSATVERVG